MPLQTPTKGENTQVVSRQKSENNSKHLTLFGLKKKEELDSNVEEDVYEALVATTHPDRVGDILSENVIEQIVEYINDESKIGSSDHSGNVRGLSLFHDWVNEGDPGLDEAGFMSNAQVVDLGDGHKGAQVEVTINKYYNGEFEGEHYDPDRIKYEIEHGKIGGLSIEYEADYDNAKQVELEGETFNFLDELKDFVGAGFARSRMIANPYAVIYKEIVDKANKENKEDEKMSDKEVKEEPKPEAEAKPEEESKEEEQSEEAPEEEAAEEEDSSEEVEAKEKKENWKEVLDSKEFKDALSKATTKNKVLKDKEENKMDEKTLSIKEMNSALKEKDIVSFKEAASRYVAERRDDMDAQLKTSGIYIGEPSVKIKCDGNKLRVVGSVKELSTKDTLLADANGNVSEYTQSNVEFNDLFVPGIIETFNQRVDLWNELGKVGHVMATPNYGFRTFVDQKTGLSVDVDDPTIVKSYSEKEKNQTAIKEYRNGISVTDFMISHSRAAIGDLFMIEAEKAAADLRKDINGDLYTAQSDNTTKVLGLEAVADSASHTTMYGKTRSAANRLAPTSAGDSYTDVSGALTTDYLRSAYRFVEVEGAQFGNLRLIMNPNQRQALYELNKSLQHLGLPAAFGFNAGGEQNWDGIPIIIDSDCPTDQAYCVDLESYFVVISRGPQLIGLAKVSAAQEAYVMINLAVVYTQPRRIHMLDNLS